MKNSLMILLLFLFSASNAISIKAIALIDLPLKKDPEDSVTVGILNKWDTVKVIDETETFFKVRKNSIIGWAPKYNFLVIKLNDSYRFAKLPWGANPEKVKMVLRKKYKLTDELNGDLLYSGTILGNDVLIRTFFNKNKKLVKVRVVLEPSEGKVIDTYNEFKEILTEKYGPPKDVYEYFDEPYRKGDGFEEQAIKLGKGHFACFWPHANDSSNLALYVDYVDVDWGRELIIIISYESKDWGEEYKRRKDKETSDF